MYIECTYKEGTGSFHSQAYSISAEVSLGTWYMYIHVHVVLTNVYIHV